MFEASPRGSPMPTNRSRDGANRLSDRIRRARRLARLTQAQLAGHCSVRPSAAAQWEARDGTAPTVENLVKIALATNVSFEWLATGRGAARLNVETPAADVEAFAQDLDEERLLQVFRRVPYARRGQVVQLLDALLG
jgi:transcriptional regulator with XRE-family HTH domain